MSPKENTNSTVADPESKQRLRLRWQKPLIDPDTGMPVEVDGCKTFQELLTLGLEEIAKVIESKKMEVPDLRSSLDERSKLLRDLWKLHAKDRFFQILLMLKKCGLDDYAPTSEGDERRGRPCSIDMRGANCQGAHFEGANCGGAYFEKADCGGANFDGAMCKEAHFEEAICLRARFDGANCAGSHFNGANCMDAHFEKATCLGALFEKADCGGANFDGANCGGAHFEEAICLGASFGGANCLEAQFEKAFCPGARFERADCERAHFERADCMDAHFDGAHCELAVFRLADAGGASFERTGLGSAEIREMKTSMSTSFGIPREHIDAETARNDVKKWLTAADVNLQIKHCWRSNGYYQEADRYQFQEMECRRKAKKSIGKYLDYFFFYLIAGYGVRLRHPLVSIVFVIVAFGVLFALSFISGGACFSQGIGKGFYYSIISFTTLGLGEVHLASGFWMNLLICLDALFGITLMPLFIVAYARRILQG